jgi:DNA adenine methylase
MNKPIPYPFVKYLGGKSKMARHILERLPLKFNTYFEPFLGGGAVFFELAKQKRFNKAVLSDMNPELINAFAVIKKDVDGLICELRSGLYKYNKKRYLEIRSDNSTDKSRIEQAARFIYLNKSCFNGLYRTNMKGEFNVPFGKYNNPVICDEENLRAVSVALKHARIAKTGFENVLREAKLGDVVYFDPPYLPTSKTSNFTGYTKERFGITDHTLLSVVFDQLSERGVSVILSNSISARELYQDYEVVSLIGGVCVGGPTEYRNSAVEEIMVMTNCRALEKH